MDGIKVRGAPAQNWRQRRSYRNTRQTGNYATIGRALAWLIPWEARNYPGVARGERGALGRAWGRVTVWRWRAGLARCPPRVALALAEEIETRARAGLGIAAALRAEAEAWRPFDRTGLGFLRVDPATGQNRRWRG